ncbi:GILT-like protein 1 [Cylas formicarius]|uniref:GILT-like protein 1 n=1 Tax=Cylas formicarius TaxID=197179 RepID=UPI002958AD84|nr:GILT-like protein 1 [Cylas formicarius]
MRHPLLFVLVGFFGSKEVFPQLTNKLHVGVMFESLCPDSQKFIKDLYRNWADVSNYVDIKFIPFGKGASIAGGSTFVCQHGPLECKGNRLMSCALARIPGQDLQVEYVNCFMDKFRHSRTDENEFGQECATSIGLNLNEILECYQSSEGAVLQLRAEQDTLKFLPKFIPTIIYNQEFNQELQDASLNDFRDVVCQLSQKLFGRLCTRLSILRL